MREANVRRLNAMGIGYVEGVTHDYVRHDTVELFAAPSVLNRAVLAACKSRRRHQESLSFLREIDKAVPAELEVLCVVDNWDRRKSLRYSSHKHPKVKAWLAARPRWHMHFNPTYSSWLNQIERFFALIADKAIRRGSFASLKRLIRRMDQFVPATTKPVDRSCGPLPLVPASKSYTDFVRESAKRNTSADWYIAIVNIAASGKPSGVSRHARSCGGASSTPSTSEMPAASVQLSSSADAGLSNCPARASAKNNGGRWQPMRSGNV
jgi:putative transposase